MPIYEYQCEDCNAKFEKLVRRAAEAADVDCPSCGQKHVSQQYSTFSARANGAAPSRSEAPSCPGGMCSNPGVCGMN
jgi:putative FmdB family regulatory protein